MRTITVRLIEIHGLTKKKKNWVSPQPGKIGVLPNLAEMKHTVCLLRKILFQTAGKKQVANLCYYNTESACLIKLR